MSPSSIDLDLVRRRKRDIQASLAEDSLVDFVRLMWPVLEPATPLVWSWPMDAICQHLEALSSGQIRKLLINCPPGFSKSLLTNVFWPAWEWISRPELRYISWSYNEKLTIRDNRRCRQLVESDVYRALWGDRFSLSSDQNTKTRYDNDKNGFRIATSVHGMGTGERADRNIWDDPHSVKGAESDLKRESAVQWWAETLPTRVNNVKTAAEVGIMQRVHEHDVSGHIIAGSFGYEMLLIEMEYEGADHPARKSVGWRPSVVGYEDPRTTPGELACPERFPLDEVDKLKNILSSHGGEYAVAGQLRQWPIARGGGLFREDWLAKRCDLSDVPSGGVTVRGWDLAGSTGKRSPFTASVKMRLVGGRVYLLDVTCERVEAAGLEDHIVTVCGGDEPGTIFDVPQDPGQAGKAQVSAFARRFHGRQLVWSTESGQKEMRAAPFASQCKAGNVTLVSGDWNLGYVNEAKSFPRGLFKDRIDASSRAYTRVAGSRVPSSPQGGSRGTADSTVVKATAPPAPAAATPLNIYALIGGSRGKQ